MTTIKDILATAIDVQEYNTNNSWGFGGGVGEMYTFSNGFALKKGTAYYRHLPHAPYVSAYNPEGHRIMDESRFPSPEKLMAILNINL